MNRNYVIFNVSELASINFSQVLETSADTVRRSIDESLTFVKYEGDMPSSVSALTTKEGPYSHSEILTILAGENWTDPNPPNGL
jgi:acid phosphatase family membrane protein YuiD